MINWLLNLFRRDPIKIEVIINVPTIHVVTSGPKGSSFESQHAEPRSESAIEEGTPSATAGSVFAEDRALDAFRKKLETIPNAEGNFGTKEPRT